METYIPGLSQPVPTLIVLGSSTLLVRHLLFFALWLLVAHSLPDCAEACGGYLTSASGELTSPGYPDLYSSNAHCAWTIHVADASSITLTFNDFDLERAPEGAPEGCVYDFLHVSL